MLATPASTPPTIESSGLESRQQTLVEEEIIEGSVDGEDGHLIDDIFNNPVLYGQPCTPPKSGSYLLSTEALSKSNFSARRKNFLKCYKEVPQTPPSQLRSQQTTPSKIGGLSPAPRRVNLRPFWQGEYERMDALLKETTAKLLETQYNLRLAKLEIARLTEFGGDVHLGLEEVARQREFMAKIGEILVRGKFEDSSSGEAMVLE